MTASLPAILRHLEDHAASLVVLRADEPPVFWTGHARLADQGAFGVLTRDAVRRLVCVPLTDEQLQTFRRHNVISVPLRIANLGAFQLEAYVQRGREELVLASAERVDAWTVFRDHHELRAEAERAPDDADVYWNLAMAHLAGGESQLAWHALERARELAPDDGSILVELGRLLGRELSRVDDAIAVLERAVALPAPAAEAHVELAILLRSSDRLYDAETVVRRGLAAHADERALLEALGVILLERAQPRDAIAVLDRSLAIHGPDEELELLLRRARAAEPPP